MTSFTGFDHEASTFFSGIENDNSKAYFDAHRDTYTASIRQPLEDLLSEVQDTYGPGRVMRPNRDIRFSKDKSPYRTNAEMWAGVLAAVYLDVNARGLRAGGGLYEPSREQLTRAREAIDGHPSVARTLKDVLERLEKKGFEIAGPSLKTAPRGFDRDHPSIELLRLNHYAAIKPLPLDASPAEIRATWRAVEPLIAWCTETVGDA